VRLLRGHRGAVCARVLRARLEGRRAAGQVEQQGSMYLDLSWQSVL
jgi:hypothetical protein